MANPSKMQDRCNAIVVPGTCSIRLVIQVLVVFFFISFLKLDLQQRGVEISQRAPQVSLDGVVLSTKPERFSHTQKVLAQLGFPVVQKVPQSFQSQEVAQSLESFVGSRRLHSEINLKVWSNRMAFVEAMEEFIAESNSSTALSKPTTKTKRWRLFFEDDLAMNPNITSEYAKVLLAKGLEVADEDGFVFLGMCGPTDCEDRQVLDKHVEAARCIGKCAHAFGFQPTAAANFLMQMSELQLPLNHRIFMDRHFYEYGKQVKKIWVVGSNLFSPVAGDHVGLIYQDRLLFPTTIG